MRMPGELELGGILDRHDSLRLRYFARQCVEQCRLARARSARHRQIHPAPHRISQQMRVPIRDRPQIDQMRQRANAVGKLANRHRGPINGYGRDNRVHAKPVGQTGVDHRAPLIDSTSQRRDDAVDGDPDLLLRFEYPAQRAEHAPSLDIRPVETVDHDFGYRIVLEQRLQRPQAGHVVKHIGDERIPLVETQPERHVGIQSRLECGAQLHPRLCSRPGTHDARNLDIAHPLHNRMLRPHPRLGHHAADRSCTSPHRSRAATGGDTPASSTHAPVYAHRCSPALRRHGSLKRGLRS